MRLCIYAQWRALKYGEEYYLNRTHAAYLEYLALHAKITTVCAVEEVRCRPLDLQVVGGVSFIPIPSAVGYMHSYFNAIKYFWLFRRLVGSFAFDRIYVRLPDPLGWMLTFLGWRKTYVINHFVGDSIDVTVRSDGNFIIRFAKVIFYIPEYILTVAASRFCANKTFANGQELARRLNGYKIQAVPVISSTIKSSEIMPFSREPADDVCLNNAKFLYVGYLRKSKGVMTVLKSFHSLLERFPDISLSIVGDGEIGDEIKEYILTHKLFGSITMHGHIDNAVQLDNLYKSHDVFCFASTSEGSPRVVIEAMLSGLLVITTRVGSVPYCFDSNKHVVFSDGFDEISFRDAMLKALSMPSVERFERRLSSYKEVQSNYTMDRFLDEVFLK